MKLSTQLQESAKFQTKGRWYNSDQVDDFIDKMIDGIDKLEQDYEMLKRDKDRRPAGNVNNRENTELKEEIVRLQGLVKASRQALAEAQSKQQTQQAPAVAVGGTLQYKKRVVEELEKERDELIENIKLLRRFREEFRNSVKRDAEKLSQQMDEMDSDELL